MISLVSLWLPIVLSAVIVFVLSSVVHMVVPIHKNDFRALSNQDQVLDALRPFNVPPGDYMLPRPADMKEMGTPAFKEKLKQGPVLIVTFMKYNPAGMGPQLVQWFLYLLVVGVFSAYLTSRALGPGTDYLRVFRFAGTTAFAAYALALWQDSIWYKRSWATTIKYTLDGLLYALMTGGTFGWLWPK
jgi:hypothetical protein